MNLCSSAKYHSRSVHGDRTFEASPKLTSAGKNMGSTAWPICWKFEYGTLRGTHGSQIESASTDESCKLVDSPEVCFSIKILQCSAVITQSIFSKLSQQTSHSSPMRASYGMSFASINSWFMCCLLLLQSSVRYHCDIDRAITAPDYLTSAGIPFWRTLGGVKTMSIDIQSSWFNLKSYVKDKMLIRLSYLQLESMCW